MLSAASEHHLYGSGQRRTPKTTVAEAWDLTDTQAVVQLSQSLRAIRLCTACSSLAAPYGALMIRNFSKAGLQSGCVNLLYVIKPTSIL